MTSQVTLRQLAAKHLPLVTATHMAAFPRSALTLLGAEAVRRYYEWQLVGPHDVFPSGAFINEQCVGFCFSGVFRGATSGFVRRNRIFLAGRVLMRPWLILNPLFRGRIDAGLRLVKLHPKQQQTTSSLHQPKRSERTKEKSFGILAIAVDPKCQGAGVGRLLMAEAEDVARRRGFSKMHLTVSTDNAQAIKFYESLKWERYYRENTWNGAMSKSLLY